MSEDAEIVRAESPKKTTNTHVPNHWGQGAVQSSAGNHTDERQQSAGSATPKSLINSKSFTGFFEQKVKWSDFPLGVHCCLWVVTLICAAAIMIPALQYKAKNSDLQYPSREGDQCRISVGSCFWFHCKDGDDGRAAGECILGACYCKLGMCSRNGYNCEKVPTNSSGGVCNINVTNNSCSVPAGDGSDLLFYDNETHSDKMHNAKNEAIRVLVDDRLFLKLQVYLFVLAALCLCVLLDFKYSFASWLLDGFAGRVFQGFAKSIDDDEKEVEKIKRDASERKEAFTKQKEEEGAAKKKKEKEMDEELTKRTESRSEHTTEKDEVEAPQTADFEEIATRRSGDEDWLLFAWFWLGEILFCVVGYYALDLGNYPTDAKACHAMPDHLLAIGIVCITLSELRVGSALPGYRTMLAGSITEHMSSAWQRNFLKAEKKRRHGCLDGDIGTLTQSACRFVGYNFLIMWGASRHFMTTLCIMIVEVLHRGVFHWLYLIQSDMWRRRVRAVKDAIKDAITQAAQQEAVKGQLVSQIEKLKQEPQKEEQWDAFCKLLAGGVRDANQLDVSIMLQFLASQGIPATFSTAATVERPDEVLVVPVTPTNVYIDLASPFATKVAPRFAGQVLLIVAYLVGLRDDTSKMLCNADDKLFNRPNMRLRVMFASTILIQFLLSTQMGASFFAEIFDWYLIYVAGTANITEKDADQDDVESIEMKWLGKNAERELERANKKPKANKLDECTAGFDKFALDSRGDMYQALLPKENEQDKEAKENEKDKEAKDKQDAIGASYLDLYAPNVKLRALMAFCVNFVGITVVLQTVPLTLLGTDDPMDFVKDCLAVGFIMMLDDVDGEQMNIRLTDKFPEMAERGDKPSKCF